MVSGRLGVYIQSLGSESGCLVNEMEVQSIHDALLFPWSNFTCRMQENKSAPSSTQQP